MATNFSERMIGPWFAVRDETVLAQFWCELDLLAARSLRQHESFIDAVVSGSSYLRRLIFDDPVHAVNCLNGNPETMLAEVCLEATKVDQAPNIDEAKLQLRQAKSRFALLTALCDLGRVWSLENVTEAMTRFADSAVQATVNFLLLEAHAAGKLTHINPQNPSINSGYVVLAMGKHGAHELNYSSDIDLIVLFDAAIAPLADSIEPTKFFVKLTQRMVDVLQDITPDGYVFRTDLRLRPDPRATQVAIAIESAATYYESLGQNWERAAYIKARPAAGDMALGEEFLARLKPYIWRKYLDFAAINDVQSLIRQIHAVKGHGEIAVEGHNLKLGRGGIREIEFFVQTQQLIAGGRNKNLRGRRTCDMLQALAAAQWIKPQVAADLQAAYIFLRTLEHRAQMVDDQQTHLVPSGNKFENYARFSGFETAEALRQALRQTLETVKSHSSRLFESADALASDTGSLVFTGGEDDPDTMETLSKLGYRQPSEVSAIVRGWHFGSYHATRDRRAREALTELMPKLLQALAQNGDADRSFFGFDGFLKGLPAGVQLLSMLKANPELLALIASILGTAPRLALGLSRQPRVLEAVLEPGFFGDLPNPTALANALDQQTEGAVSLDDIMDRARIFGREQKFRVGVRVLSETVSAEAAGLGFANLADVMLTRLLLATEAHMAAAHGTIQGGEVAIIAMGKLGGREMTAGSDLDLMLVYAHATGAEVSNGDRPLSVGQYYARLAQRFITALSAPTAEGVLYEVDMRLRPSGSKGPVAVSLASFVSYQKQSAWTWEKLALTRARIVTAPPGLGLRLNAAIASSLCSPRDEIVTRKDVVDMRGLMLREHKATSPWEIKRVRGGLVELEFIAQFLQLLHAPLIPEIRSTNTFQALSNLRDHQILAAPDADVLLSAWQLYSRLTQILRLCLEGEFDPQVSLPGLNRAVAQAAQMPDVGATQALLAEHQVAVAQLFDKIIGPPVF